MENTKELTAQENFLRQSLNDAWNDFELSIKDSASALWDWVVVTASNERQAAVFEKEIERRLEEKRIPSGCRYLVVPDTDGKRIGSGGASLNAFANIAREIGLDQVSNQKILMIHSGGDSKRIPQYSAKGKLFAPVPRELPNGFRSTIFDELLVSVAGVPGRIQTGTLMLPSDTVLVFNPLQLDLSDEAAGLSMKASVFEGTEHGVFLEGNKGKVASFMHKLSERELYSSGAVDDYGKVDIDTGCIWLGKSVIAALLGLVSTDGQIDSSKLNTFVNPDACLSLYADFLYPLASDSSLDIYLTQTPENVFTDQLEFCRRALWDALNIYNLALIRLMPSRYIHFGTTWETWGLLNKKLSDYYFLDWQRKVASFSNNQANPILNNALVENQVHIADTAYVENAVISGSSVIEKGAIVSSININSRIIPANTVVNGMIQQNRQWVCRIYGVTDNPKESSGARFLKASIDDIIARTGIKRSEVWDQSPTSIWNAKIFPVCDTEQDALDSALILFRITEGTASDEEIASWCRAKKISLNESFNKADVALLAQREDEIENKIRVEKFISLVEAGFPTKELIDKLIITRHLKTRLESVYEKAKEASFPLNMRLFLALSDILKRYPFIEEIKGVSAQYLEELAYEVIKEGIVSNVLQDSPFLGKISRIANSPVVVDLPVRVNFCGSPSDAAPYCLEHGGTMLDAALLLDGELPVHVEVRKINEPVIRFESLDQNISKDFIDIDEVRECGNPLDGFDLHKACIVASGVLDTYSTLSHLIESHGGGLKLSTSVNVPKGSGLGTSSILAAACVKALDIAFGIDPDDHLIYDQVFAVEQLMGTCGGWQDQVGGLTPGIKYFTSSPGMRQRVQVEYLSLEPDALRELEERFVLVFSGQRRLARNVLRSETNQLIRNDENALNAVERIRELTVLMRYHLLRGDITRFAQCMTEQLHNVKMLDKGATNTCVDYIFDVCADLIEGKSVCGAGGGGFLQMILKKNVTKEMLVQRIENEFHGCGVEVWNSSLYLKENAGSLS